MYYRKANAALIVYDTSSENSFDEMKLWVKGKSILLLSYIIIYDLSINFVEFSEHSEQIIN